MLIAEPVEHASQDTIREAGGTVIPQRLTEVVCPTLEELDDGLEESQPDVAVLVPAVILVGHKFRAIDATRSLEPGQCIQAVVDRLAHRVADVDVVAGLRRQSLDSLLVRRVVDVR
eukprot:3815816-Rhodomonas_salina.1